MSNQNKQHEFKTARIFLSLNRILNSILFCKAASHVFAQNTAVCGKDPNLVVLRQKRESCIGSKENGGSLTAKKSTLTAENVKGLMGS